MNTLQVGTAATFAVDSGMNFPLGRPARLAVFASGRGSNLRSLLSAFPPNHPLGSVCLVVSNRAEAGALSYAEACGVPTQFIPFGQNCSHFEEVAAQYLQQEEVDLVCLAGFMRILSSPFVSRYAGRILNIHPSLLPRFPGLHPQQQALAAGVNESGCTVHFVDAGMDTGQIVLQKRVKVHSDDDADALSARILQVEHAAYPEAVRLVLEGKVVITMPDKTMPDKLPDKVASEQ